MTLAELLDRFAGSLTTAISHAPDDYPEWRYTNYLQNKEKLLQLWSEIKPRLKRDLDQVAYISQRLTDGIAAYDAGDKPAGKKAMLDIYNAEPDKLR